MQNSVDNREITFSNNIKAIMPAKPCTLAILVRWPEE